MTSGGLYLGGESGTGRSLPEAGRGGTDGFLGWPVSDVNARNEAGETALHRAAGCRGDAAPIALDGSGASSSGGGGGLSVMGHLLALGADPGARDARGLTPLMTVLVKGESCS